MAETGKQIRLSKAAKEFNIGISTIVDFLHKKGHTIESNPNTKLAKDIYEILMSEFQSEKDVKQEADKIGLDYAEHQTVSIGDRISDTEDTETTKEQDELFIKDVSSFDYEAPVTPPPPKVEVKETIKETLEVPEVEEKKEEKVTKPVEEVKETPVKEIKPVLDIPEKVSGKIKDPIEEVVEKITEGGDLKILGKIDLDKIISKPRKQRKKPKKTKKVVPVSEKPEEKVIDEKVEPVEEVVTPVKADVKTEEPVIKETPAEIKEEIKPKKEDINFIKTKVEKLTGPTILGSIKLPVVKKPEKKKPVESKPRKITGRTYML